jgi:hypothetical protein
MGEKVAEDLGAPATLKYDVANRGWYYIRISDDSGRSYNETFSFKLSFEPVVDQEPDNEIGDAVLIQLGQAVSGYIFPAGEVDFYKLRINDSGTLAVSLTSVPREMKGRIILYGKNFNFLGEKVAEDIGAPATLKLDLSTPGWYYIRISDDSGRSYKTAFSFEPKLSAK